MGDTHTENKTGMTTPRATDWRKREMPQKASYATMAPAIVRGGGSLVRVLARTPATVLTPPPCFIKQAPHPVR